jgi:hypothetical protein
MLAEEEKTQAGFPAKSPLSHKDEVLSRKYFIAAAIAPKRVGLPNARPEHWRKSSSVA